MLNSLKITLKFLFVNLIAVNSIAQDVIIKSTGERINCAIISVTDKQVAFKIEGANYTQYLGNTFVKKIIYDQKAETKKEDDIPKQLITEEKTTDIEKILESKEPLENVEESKNDTCDNIIFRSGDEVSVKVIVVDAAEIKYVKCPQTGGPVYSVFKSTIFMIKYSNGNKDIIPIEDLIIKTDGNKIKCTILSVTNEQVIYKIEGNSQTQYIGKDFILKIVQGSKAKF